MMKIKVGMMPGKLVEVVVEEKTSARRIFEIAGVEISNHEIRLDGEKIDIDRAIERGNLLVAMKMIKGNSKTIKVGMMPGKLVSIAYTGEETAKEIFELAEIEISNHEIRLDGEKIGIDNVISGGNLLVAMKMIKGNADYKVTNCTPEEIKMLLNVELPQKINKDDINMFGDELLSIVINGEEFIVEEDMFLSVYNDMVEDKPAILFEEVVETKTCGCTHKMAIDVLKEEYEKEMKDYNTWLGIASRHKERAEVIQELINKIEG